LKELEPKRPLVGVTHRRIENGLRNPASQSQHLWLSMLFAPSGRVIREKHAGNVKSTSIAGGSGISLAEEEIQSSTVITKDD
jgi:hypothetical protein